MDGQLRLPLEIWGLVVELLPKEDQKTCLFASRVLGNVARARLFSHVTILFGLWRPFGAEHKDDAAAAAYLNEIDQLSTSSWEIMRYIRRDAEFAKLIKKLSVRAHVPAGTGTYERHCLIETLESLPSLTSFVYHGMFPLLQPETIDALANTCGSVLTEFRAPVLGGRNWLGPAFFAKFTKLEKLVLVKEPYEDTPARGDNWAARACIEKVAEMRKLRSLHVGGEAIWALPVRPFAYLRELVIQEPENLGAIGLVLRHCSPQLQSLSLVLDNLWVEKYLNAAFDSDPKALPNLRSFKLVMHGDSFNRYPSDVSDFLTNKKHLRRLDVDLNMDPADAGVYPQFFELLPELPELEVLGVSLSGYEFTSEKLKRLDGKLPLGLTALLIHFDFEINDVSAREWMDVFRKRESLRYLHILDNHRTLDLKQQLLEDHPAPLELVGYGPHLRWIERDPETGLPAYSPRWSDAKVRFREVEDFGCEDWEWLLRYHDWGELNSLYPGLPREADALA
ncbi:uncharacterized protein TRAVEDRAFT_49867 [Trametes versicolor FP-101664 SS1]|uniref:uncharacterized protein n=1 Tax=Trametes versicolor (strain FP-101664) TaxID=717944 RepID=UPI0004623505|nr:uncharacterized protein TRAVEDRAFT_49867 [Trametes versicolor FP-101664 SS1]EIW57055.1 hypothetical protein TRAVEDRAFT_49867 [Trametes versicolor FP-101664 SS1]